MKPSLRVLSFLVLSASAWGATRPAGTLIKVPNGISRPDFTADGKADLIVSAHRENFNAHSFEVVTFYVSASVLDDGKPIWNLVPIQRDGKESLQTVVSGGADCVIHDFRLLAGPRPDSATLILADRDLGDDYAATEKVTFTFLMLSRNDERLVGEALYTFVKTRTVRSQRSYCDVEKAFASELSLGGEQSG